MAFEREVVLGISRIDILYRHSAFYAAKREADRRRWVHFSIHKDVYATMLTEKMVIMIKTIWTEILITFG